jgi:hypothetical protein
VFTSWAKEKRNGNARGEKEERKGKGWSVRENKKEKKEEKKRKIWRREVCCLFLFVFVYWWESRVRRVSHVKPKRKETSVGPILKWEKSTSGEKWERDAWTKEKKSYVITKIPLKLK